MGLLDEIKKLPGKAMGVIGGKESGQDLPGQYTPGSISKAAQGFMGKGGILAPGQGQQGAGQAYSAMQAGMGGYTAPQEQALFARQADRTRAQQNLASQQARQAATQGGLAGGFAAKMQGRLGQQAMAQQAEQARDLSLANIDEMQRRQQNVFTGGLGLEGSRRAGIGQAAQLAQQEEANRQFAHQAAMNRYAMDPKKRSGGLIGGALEKLSPGMGGNVWSEMRYG